MPRREGGVAKGIAAGRGPTVLCATGGGGYCVLLCAAVAPPPLLFACCMPVRWPDTHHSSLAHRRVALARGAASAGRQVLAWWGECHCTIEPVDVMPVDAAAPAVGALIRLVSGVLGVEAIALVLYVCRAAVRMAVQGGLSGGLSGLLCCSADCERCR